MDNNIKGKPDSLSFTMKKIKVENWSSFLLQKLYHCFTKQKYCDFTLKMVDGNLKVHSVVMNACSNYFIQINLENSSIVTLPPHLRKELMEPIVNFIYSGVLTFKTNIQKDLIEASKILKIDILTKLIDTEDVINDTKSLISKTIPFEDAHIKQRHFLSSGDSPGPAPAPYTPSPSSIYLPGPSSVIKSTPTSSNSGKLMSTKKLPFWKKRSTTPGASSSFSSSSSSSRKHEEEQEDIKPSRFELPEDSCPNSAYFYVPNFENPLSYESESIVRPDEKILKRVTKSAESVSESKKIKLIKSAVVDIQREEEGEGDEILPDDDYDEYEEQFPCTSSSVHGTPPPKPILKTDKFDSARKKSVRFTVGAAVGENINQREDNLPNQQPDLTEEKIITRKIVTIKEEPDDISPLESSTTDLQHSSTTRQVPSQSPVVAGTIGGPNSIHLSLNNPHELANIDPNHAKIIEEVLQKYPDLVRGNRNFKLKVVNSDNQIINYIMNNKNKCLVNTGGKKKNTKSVGQNAVSTHEPVTNGSVVKSHMPGGGLESQAPSSFDCKYCGPNLSEPLPDYRTWRTHMQDVHGEKFDVRVCEYCGLKLSKRNLYLYHLLRVHGVRSESMRFPECSYCSYIALTENLLYKHCKNVHNKLIGFVCSTCNTMFKTNDQLICHIQLTEHGSEKKFHACKHCGKTFDRSVNLKAHLRANHNQEQDNNYSNATSGGETGDSSHEQVVIKQEVDHQTGAQTPVQVVTPPPNTSEYDTYVRQQYIEVPVMQSNAYGTLVLPGGVTIVDTNNSRLSECNPEPSEQMITSETSLGAAPTTMEPNEAVLGTNECGQTVLILNGTQQYILEQQADGRLILPDILANNCVISYATEDTSVGGQQGEYEIINVEQAQQEVMLSSQGMLVSHQSETDSRSDPGGGGGYGAHEGETILDSTTPSNQMVLGSTQQQGSNQIVLGSSPYTMSGSQTMIQTIITPSSGLGSHEHTLGSVIQSTSTSENALLTPIRHSRSVNAHSLPPSIANAQTISPNRRQTSSQNEVVTRDSRLITEQTRMEIDDGELSSATHNEALSRGDGGVLISGQQEDQRRDTPAQNEVVSGPGPDYDETSGEYTTGAEYDDQDDSAYNQDEYDSEGGMVIDAGDPSPHDLDTADDPPPHSLDTTDAHDLGTTDGHGLDTTDGHGLDTTDGPLSPSDSHLNISEHHSPPETQSTELMEHTIPSETGAMGLEHPIPSESGLISSNQGILNDPNGADEFNGSSDGLSGPSDGHSGPSDGHSGPSDGLSGPSDGLSGPSDGLSGPDGSKDSITGQTVQRVTERTISCEEAREKIQALEQDWGDNLEEDEEMEEDEEEEEQVGPSRGEI